MLAAGREQRGAAVAGNKRKASSADSPSMPTRGSANAGKRQRTDEQPSASATSGVLAPMPPFLRHHSASIKTTLAKSYRSPTQAQSSAWPIAVAGRDVGWLALRAQEVARHVHFCCQCCTGLWWSKGRASEHIGGQLTVPPPSGLVLATTRELAIQIGQEATRFGKPLGVRCVCLFGGMPKHNQINSLNGGANAYPHLVVATPGRLLDLCKPQPPSKSKLRRDPKAPFGPPALSLSGVTCLVLDEADRMLDLGFKPQLSELARMVDGVGRSASRVQRRQTLCFVRHGQSSCAAAKMFLGPDPVHITVSAEGESEGSSRKSKLQVEESTCNKECLTGREGGCATQDCSNTDPRGQGYCVLQTKRTCDMLAARFAEMQNSAGENAIVTAALHSNLAQSERLQVVKDFRASKACLLLATDVVAAV